MTRRSAGTTRRWVRSARRIAVLALAWTAWGVLACEPPDTPAAGDDERPPVNLLLVSIDSLRADHLASYGYHRVTSPHLDRLAEEGVLFETMVADSSWTLPTHLTMMTGLSSWAHGVIADTQRLGDGVETLAERLRARGYRTEGFASGPYLHPVFGFGRGFDHYEVVSETVYDQPGVTLEGIASQPAMRGELDRAERTIRGEVTSDVLAQRVEEAIARSAQQPFFIFVHMFDVHYDYAAPEAYWRRFNPDYQGELRGENFKDDPRIRASMPPEELAQLMALYDGEIAWTDHHLGKMLEALDLYGVADRTLVVVTADHGEEFFDHGEKGHRHTLYDEQLLVPFVLRLPGVLPSGRRVGMQSRMVDIAPTLLDLLGMDPDLGAGGRSLAPYARAERPEEDLPALSFLYVNKLLVKTLRTPTTKLEISMPLDMVNTEYTGRLRSFDLVDDPGEQRPGLEEDAHAALQRRFAELFEGEESSRRRTASGADARLEVPESLRSALEALGYTDGGSP